MRLRSANLQSYKQLGRSLRMLVGCCGRCGICPRHSIGRQAAQHVDPRGGRCSVLRGLLLLLPLLLLLLSLQGRPGCSRLHPGCS